MKPVIYGVYAGLATIAFYLIFYALSPKTMLHPVVYLSSFVFYIIAMYIAVWTAEHSEFRLSLREAFTVFIVANGLYAIFYYALTEYYDPKLIDLQYEMMKSGGWTNNGKIKREDLNNTPNKAFFNYSFSLIGGFILSVIVVFVVNRRRQMYYKQ